MGILGLKSFEAVLGIITGGADGGEYPTPFKTYRTATELSSFFRRHGVEYYKDQFEARKYGMCEVCSIRVWTSLTSCSMFWGS